MPIEDFRRFGHQVVDWVADYWAHPERHAVLPDVQPGALVDKLPVSGPDEGEPMERILADFERQILPHVAHWNHPGFLAYFATSGSAPGVLAETLAAGLNNVGLLWKASPALAELEQVTLRWLADWMNLPADWFGMIHTTASDASLHAVMAAREAARRADEESGKAFELPRMTVYTSEQAHSSIEKTDRDTTHAALREFLPGGVVGEYHAATEREGAKDAAGGSARRGAAQVDRQIGGVQPVDRDLVLDPARATYGGLQVEFA
jgi:aromatic-L-amino-acid decarboxylase